MASLSKRPALETHTHCHRLIPAPTRFSGAQPLLRLLGDKTVVKKLIDAFIVKKQLQLMAS